MSVAALSLAPRAAVPDAPRRRPGAALVLFALVTGGYLALGVVLVLGHDSIAGDALARVGNAHQVLFSRDPKLSAVGFVWTPLPSLLDLPLLLLTRWWPALAERGFAGVVESALFMAGFVVQVRGVLLDLRVRPGARTALVALVAVDPLIAYYGANGMSEAMLLFFSGYAVRQLLRWWATEQVGPLARAAVALALGYWSRYELVGAAAAATLLVGLRSWQRTSPDRIGSGWSRRVRWSVAGADVVVMALPAGASLLLWAALSWIITGQPFAQFTSQYGNSALVTSSGSSLAGTLGSGTGERLGFAARQLAALEPAALPVAALCLAVCLRRRDGRALVPAAVFGAVLAVQGLVLLSGSSFGWLRYQITVVPLVVVLVGLVLAQPGDAPAARRSRLDRALAAVLVLAVAAGVVSTARVLDDPRLAREEAQLLVPVVRSELGRPPAGPDGLGRFRVQRDVARALDAERLPPGSVLTDTANAFGVVLATRHPDVFVITTDDDFAAAVSDPASHGVRYLLVADQGQGTDALQVARPGLYETGAGIARVVRTFPASVPGGPSWRLLSVDR